MSFQGFFIRTCSLLNNTRLLLNNRPVQINQVAGVKHKFIDQLKTLKVPEKPKRPLTPYFKFCQDHRSSIIKEHPTWKITQIAVQCASDWKSIDPETKKKYEHQYKNEMEEFAQKYSDYMKKLTPEQREALDEFKDDVKASKVRRERKKKERENDKPKRPMGPYLMYVMEQAKVNPKTPYSELLSKLKGTWNDMAPGDKAPYTQAATKAKEQYDQALTAWEMKMIQEGNKDLVRRNTLTGRPRAKTE